MKHSNTINFLSGYLFTGITLSVIFIPFYNKCLTLFNVLTNYNEHKLIYDKNINTINDYKKFIKYKGLHEEFINNKK